VDGRIRILSNPMTFKIGSSLCSRLDRVIQNNMAAKQNVLAVLVALISSRLCQTTLRHSEAGVR